MLAKNSGLNSAIIVPCQILVLLLENDETELLHLDTPYRYLLPSRNDLLARSKQAANFAVIATRFA